MEPIAVKFYLDRKALGQAAMFGTVIGVVSFGGLVFLNTKWMRNIALKVNNGYDVYEKRGL
jgi:hypothetical protein